MLLLNLFKSIKLKNINLKRECRFCDANAQLIKSIVFASPVFIYSVTELLSVVMFQFAS